MYLLAHGLLSHGIGTHGILDHGIGAHGLLSHGIGTHGILAHGIGIHKYLTTVLGWPNIIKGSSGSFFRHVWITDGLFTLALGACLRVYNPEHDLLQWSNYPP